MSTIRIAQAQINPILGDFEYNKKKILKYIEIAREKDADIVIFPELSLCGCPPEDLLLKPGFLETSRKFLDEISKKVSGIVAIIGYPDTDGKNVYDALAVIQEGNIKGKYYKIELQDFEERRYFKEGKEPFSLKLKEALIVPSIGKDIWIEGNVLEDFARKIRADIVLNLSSSPFHIKKFQVRIKVAQRFAKRSEVFLVYTNLVGGQDELVFDGGSFIVSPDGNIIACAKRFSEQLLVTDIKVKEERILEETYIAESLSPLEEVYNALVIGTRDYVNKNGFEKVLIGLSGGIDSSVVAAIAVDALGRENVIGVTMPSRFTSSETLNDAERLAKNLGIRLIKLPIEPIYETYLKILEKVFDTSEHTVAHENLQARIRGNLLMAISNRFGYLVLTTGNKSETAVGYCTLYGDTAGGFAPIKDVPKTMVYELARYINSIWAKEIIPESVIKRDPTAELRPNQKDEDTLPPYPVLDRIIHEYVEENKEVEEIIEEGFEPDVVKDVIRMIKRSEYKRRQSPPGIKITAKSFGKDWRFPITNRYMK